MNRAAEIKVWDPLVRAFHWALVGAFATAYITGEDWLDLHVWAGYGIAGLVLFRLLWGVVGTRHARFSDFVRGPRAVAAYLRALLRRRAPRYLGHNPAGGAMIVALLVSLVVTTLTGLALYGIDPGAGPMAGWLAGGSEFWKEGLEETHEVFANLTLFLVGLHVIGVLIAGYLHGENLVRAMFTGRKAAGHD